MKLFLIGFLGAGLGMLAQAPQAAVRVSAPGTLVRGTRPGNTVGTAVLGFFLGSGPAELNTIFGIFGAARLGEPLAVPQNVSRLYLSTRQRYALVETSGGEVAVWTFGDGAAEPVPVAGALPQPDLVTFSPRGDSAVLYRRDSGNVQVIKGLPGKPAVQKIPAIDSSAAITMVAVSDDATVIVTKDSAGSLQISSEGGPWEPFYGAYSPSAWTFVPRTHDLVLSDSQENAIFLVAQAGAKNTRIVLAEQSPADHVAVTGNGQTVLALDSQQNRLWTVDLKSRVSKVTTPAQSLSSLTALHSGSTFLAPSRDGSLALLKISDSGAVETATIPAVAGR